MFGRAQGADGDGFAERGRERVEVGKGRHPGADGAPPPQPQTSTPVSAAPGTVVRRQISGGVHPVRPGSHPFHHHPRGNHRPRGGQEAAPAPGGLRQAVGLRLAEHFRAVSPSEYVAAGVAQVGGEGDAALDVEAVVKNEKRTFVV